MRCGVGAAIVLEPQNWLLSRNFRLPHLLVWLMDRLLRHDCVPLGYPAVFALVGTMDSRAPLE